MPRHAVAALLALALGACVDADGPTLPAPGAAMTTAIVCQGGTRARMLECETRSPGASRDLIVGGQRTYVTLNSGSVSYQADSALFTFALTVQNLIDQPLATLDGQTPSAAGVRIFFQEAPAATRVTSPQGPSSIAVLGDGEGTFTGSGQPYFEYSGVLLGDDGILWTNEVSGARTWRLRIPPNVESFTFAVFVAADVPYPQGYLDVRPGGYSLLVGDSVPFSAIMRNAVGVPAEQHRVTWTSSSPAIATVDESGVVIGRSSGYALITATADDKVVESAVVVSDPGGQSYRALSAGGVNACLMTAERSAFCFGEGIFGQLGSGGFTDYAIRPVRVLNEPWDTVTVGYQNACGLKSGKAFCWGLDVFGADGAGAMLPECTSSPFGSSSYGCAPAPLPVAGDLTFTRLSTGGNQLRTIGPPYTEWSCGLAAGGGVSCWGGDANGEMGDGAQYPLDNPAPKPMAGAISFRFTVNGWDHGCGIDAGDRAWCWGHELQGELGNDAQVEDVVVSPEPVQGGLLFRQLDAGRAHTCGVTLEGVVYCWGSNGFGQLGTTAAIPDCGTDPRYPMPCSPAPVPIASELRFVRVAVGLRHSCAITTDGELWCWGDATALGAGDPRRVPGVEPCTAGSSRLCVRTPVRARTTLRFRDLDGLHGATCALSLAGHAYCWPLWGVAPGGVTTVVPTRVPEPVS
jgi:hypothetical protein